MARFAVTIFLGAFLLFQVQPILGRFILPWFGGGAGVWTVCMLFFQVALLAGYAYAHLMSRYATPRTQLIVHLALIGLSLAFLPITPAAETWRSTGDTGQATLRILALLSMQIGVPYLLLASTGPLLQNWFDREYPGRSPYRLYSLSNLGSLLALLSYPFIFEPWLTLKTQGWSWTIGFVAYLAACAWCAVLAYQASAKPRADVTSSPPLDATGSPLPVPTTAGRPKTKRTGSGLPVASATPPSESKAAIAAFSPRVQQSLWIALSAVGSMMLIATTNQICQDLAVVPMLWVLPLAIYLITFIICFDADRWYHRGVFGGLFAASVLAVNYVIHHHLTAPMWQHIAAFGAALFACCMICHGELVRLRPDPRRLTSFYLSIATGGALGGVLVALVAPVVLPDYFEYHFGLLAASLLAALCMFRAYAPRLEPPGRRAALMAGTASIAALAISLGLHIYSQQLRDISTVRNFYGVLHVREQTNPFLGRFREMWHGQTRHGTQFLDADKRRWPTAYFGDDSGIGLAIEHAAYGKHPAKTNDPRFPRKAVRIGVIGLGVGTLAAHAEAGDLIRFYEINPEVVRVAREDFTFLSDTPATVEMVVGDARLMLEREAAANQFQRFDVLAVDAFNSDSIPLHLVTREAMAVYRQHLAPNGLLVFNISNRYVNMTPVLRGLARREYMQMVIIESPQNIDRLGAERAVFVILTADESFAKHDDIKLAAEPPAPKDARVLYWTDDFASLWSVMSSDGIGDIGKWNAVPMGGQMLIDRAELVDRFDERQIMFRSRRLLADTGRFPLAVVTVRGKTEGDGRPVDFSRIARDRFVDLGLHAFGNETGVMVLISVDDKLAHFEFGKAWDTAGRDEGARIVNTILLPGLASGKTSAAIVATVEALDALARRQPGAALKPPR